MMQLDDKWLTRAKETSGKIQYSTPVKRYQISEKIIFGSSCFKT
jgi:hypothetical protein